MFCSVLLPTQNMAWLSPMCCCDVLLRLCYQHQRKPFDFQRFFDALACRDVVLHLCYEHQQKSWDSLSLCDGKRSCIVVRSRSDVLGFLQGFWRETNEDRPNLDVTTGQGRISEFCNFEGGGVLKPQGCWALWLSLGLRYQSAFRSTRWVRLGLFWPSYVELRSGVYFQGEL